MGSIANTHIDAFTRMYFIGIGGIGMSALARYFHAQGKHVTGYDKTPTELTRKLEQEGIQVTYEDSLATLDPDAECVVITPAIPASSNQWQAYKSKGTPIYKRAQVLGMLSEAQYTIAIGGTHGKTTTSSMVAYLLRSGGVDATAFLGGIVADFDSNVCIGKSNITVVEADEFDRSFLTLKPSVAAIMSMDADHLDVYGHDGAMIDAYKGFSLSVIPDGLLLFPQRFEHYITKAWQNELKRKKVIGLTFGLTDDAHICADNIRVEDGVTCFDYVAHNNRLPDFKMQLAGNHNIENALVAISIAIYEGVEADVIRDALSKFKGIKRRFERVVDTEKVHYIDDYAHHPTELRAAIAAARSLFPQKKLTGIFQPHLYSRTRDFAEGFAQALDELDEVLLMPIYPAREQPIAGVESQIIADKMKSVKPIMLDHKGVIDYLHGDKVEVLMTLGAGDIDLLVPQIKKLLTDG